jgi:hypothetical protein
MSFLRHAALLLCVLTLAAPAVADTLQPLSRHDDADDAVLGQADLLAKLNRGGVYRLVPGAPTPAAIGPTDLLVTEEVALDAVRPGDAIVVRISGNPAPYADEPVGLRRVVRVERCAGCRELVATVTSSTGQSVLRLRAAQLVGRVLYAFDARSGDVRELRDTKVVRPTTFVDEYNGWRPEWPPQRVERRLEEIRGSTRARPGMRD